MRIRPRFVFFGLLVGVYILFLFAPSEVLRDPPDLLYFLVLYACLGAPILTILFARRFWQACKHPFCEGIVEEGVCLMLCIVMWLFQGGLLRVMFD